MDVFCNLERQLGQDREPLGGGVDLEQSLAVHRAERSSGAEVPDRGLRVVSGRVRLGRIAPGGDTTELGDKRPRSSHRDSRLVDGGLVGPNRRHRQTPDGGQGVGVLGQPRLDNDSTDAARDDSPPTVGEARRFFDPRLGGDGDPLVTPAHLRAPGDEDDTEDAVSTQAVNHHLAVTRLEDV